MFDIGFPELALASLVALLVLGPERLPSALRTLGLWLGRIRRGFNTVKSEFEREIGMDEVRRQLHNEQIMEEVKKIQQETREFSNEIAGTNSGLAPGELADHPDLSGEPNNSVSTTLAETSDGSAKKQEGPVSPTSHPTQMEILNPNDRHDLETDKNVEHEDKNGG